MSDYRILVTGSRSWADFATIRAEIGVVVVELVAATAEPYPRITVVHGAAKGADQLAGRAADELGLTQERWPADWGCHGRRAGYARNEYMVALGADVCLAFVLPCTVAGCRRKRPHGSHGASHCADLARKAGIPVRRFTGDTSATLT